MDFRPRDADMRGLSLYLIGTCESRNILPDGL